jgi:hypothetical protein
MSRKIVKRKKVSWVTVQIRYALWKKLLERASLNGRSLSKELELILEKELT